MRVLVTGAAGSIGSRFCATTKHEVIPTDIDTMDVTSRLHVVDTFLRERPGAVIHLAAHKHAPVGELYPEDVTRVNIQGTENVIHAARLVGARIVVASTCKAADPETVYGASKLIAERLTLNAGGVVARFHNVRETSGNVFEIWRNQDQVGWTDAWRYFIGVDDACRLLEGCLTAPSGRYMVHPGCPRHMRDIAREVHPDREIVKLPLRRGDRLREPYRATSEWVLPYDGDILRIVGAHDPGRRAA